MKAKRGKQVQYTKLSSIMLGISNIPYGMFHSRFLNTVRDIYSPPKVYNVIGKNVMSIAINIAGSKLATRILLGHNTLMPTQKIKIEPT